MWGRGPAQRKKREEKKFCFVPVVQPDLRVWQEETLSDTAPPLPSMKLLPFKGTKLGRSKGRIQGTRS